MLPEPDKPDPDAQPTSKTKVFKLISNVFIAMVKPKQSTIMQKYSINDDTTTRPQSTASNNAAI